MAVTSLNAVSININLDSQLSKLKWNRETKSRLSTHFSLFQLPTLFSHEMELNEIISI